MWRGSRVDGVKCNFLLKTHLAEANHRGIKVDRLALNLLLAHSLTVKHHRLPMEEERRRIRGRHLTRCSSIHVE